MGDLEWYIGQVSLPPAGQEGIYLGLSLKPALAVVRKA